MHTLDICKSLLSDPSYITLQNEFQTQTLVFSEPDIKEKVVNWLRKYEPESSEESNAKSESLREMGNRKFRANKKKLALEASRYYTNAIIAATDGSRELALAHANRSASISEFGYYKEAYEDCVCAIDYGYPTEHLEKIIARQASYASKLGDYEKLRACVEKLRTMELSRPFAKLKATFEEDLAKLSKDQKPEAEAVCKDDQKPEAEAVSKDDQKPEAAASSKDHQKPEAEAVSKDDQKPEAEGAPKDDQKPEAEGASKDDQKPEAEAASKDDRKPEAEAASKDDQKPEAAAASKDDQKPEAGASSKDDQKPEAEAVSKDDQKPEAEAVSKDDQKPEAAAVSKDDQKPEAAAVSKDDQKPEAAAVSKDDQKPEAEAVPKDNYISQKVLHDPEKGRYLTTSKDIAKGEVILTEKAFAWVPVDELKICANCAEDHIIPFPCNLCSKIFYCSLKCRKAHEMIHKFECYGYKCGIISTIGILHLAMNVLLNGFPSIIEKVKNCKSGEEIWETIEEIAKSGEKGYAELLSLSIHFKSTQTVQAHIFLVHCKATAVVTYYLMEFTSFFDLFKDTECTENQWAVIISALLLRHSFQMMYNAFTSMNLFSMVDYHEFRLLSDMWEKPLHLKKGQLHMYSRVRRTFAAIFPHLSVCNHSCEPSIRMKFDGNVVTAYARNEMKQDAEIHNSYLPDFKNNPKALRKGNLKMLYNFDCKCTYCSDEDCDAAYLQFYKYRCHNPKCKVIFVPQLQNQEWWLEAYKTPFLTCPNCQVNLKLDWYWVFYDLTLDPSSIGKIIEIIKISEKILVGYSELRRHMHEMTAQMVFSSNNQGEHLTDMEFVALGEGVKYCLDVIEQRHDVKSVMYTAKATYALDLMAHGKYSDFDCKKIRISLEMLSTEMRSIFNNYINDYIGEKFYADDQSSSSKTTN